MAYYIIYAKCKLTYSFNMRCCILLLLQTGPSKTQPVHASGESSRTLTGGGRMAVGSDLHEPAACSPERNRSISRLAGSSTWPRAWMCGRGAGGRDPHGRLLFPWEGAANPLPCGLLWHIIQGQGRHSF